MNNNGDDLDKHSSDDHISSSENKRKSNKAKNKKLSISAEQFSNSLFNKDYLDENDNLDPIAYCDAIADKLSESYLKKLITKSCLRDDDIYAIQDFVSDLIGKNDIKFYFDINRLDDKDIGAIIRADSFIVNITSKGKILESFTFVRNENNSNLAFLRLTDTINTSHPIFINNFKNTCKYSDGNLCLNIFSKGGIFNADLENLYKRISTSLKCQDEVETFLSSREGIYDITLYILSIISEAFAIFKISNRNLYARPSSINNGYILKDDSFEEMLNAFDKWYDNSKPDKKKEELIESIYSISKKYVDQLGNLESISSYNDYDFSSNIPKTIIALPNKSVIVNGMNEDIVDIKYASCISNLQCYDYLVYNEQYPLSIAMHNGEGYEYDDMYFSMVCYSNKFRNSYDIMKDIYTISKYLKYRESSSSKKK